MAPPSRRSAPTVTEDLLREAFRFEFFQAVRALERAGDSSDAAPPRSAVAEDAAPAAEAVRFRVLPSACFPTSAISELRPAPPPEEGQPSPPPELVVTFMGMVGPSGVLPQHYTSLLIERIREKDYALRDFLDLFHHRMISFFYRAWKKHRFWVVYEELRRSGASSMDLFTHAILCMAGMGTGGLTGRLLVHDETFAYYAAHLGHFPKNASALEAIVADYFNLPAKVIQFCGRWLYLAPDDRSSFPTGAVPAGRNNRLGVDFIVGDRLWDVQGKFRIRLGPLSFQEFKRFMPPGDALKPLCQLVRTCVGPSLEFDVQPVLAGPEVPWLSLSGGKDDGPRLGWTTWLRSRPFEQDVEDAVFSLEAV
jgi:type VI secretion system protein ImpH